MTVFPTTLNIYLSLIYLFFLFTKPQLDLRTWVVTRPSEELEHELHRILQGGIIEMATPAGTLSRMHSVDEIDLSHLHSMSSLLSTLHTCLRTITAPLNYEQLQKNENVATPFILPRLMLCQDRGQSP